MSKLNTIKVIDAINSRAVAVSKHGVEILMQTKGELQKVCVKPDDELS